MLKDRVVVPILVVVFIVGAAYWTSLPKSYKDANATGQRQRVTVLIDPPEKIRLVPDIWHIHNVGRLSDGRLFLVDGQLDFKSGATKDFVCTFVFDKDGRLIDQTIELVGQRGSYPDGKVSETFKRHIAALGEHTITDIWIRPFSVKSHDTVFGFIPRRRDSGEWYVEFMPGNTLAFYPPWDEGGYDT